MGFRCPALPVLQPCEPPEYSDEDYDEAYDDDWDFFVFEELSDEARNRIRRIYERMKDGQTN